MDKQTIQERINHLKAHIPTDRRMDLIRKNFISIKTAHEWFKADTKRSEDDRALARLEVIYKDLQKLGVDKLFSAALFIFGADLTDQLINQLDE